MQYGAVAVDQPREDTSRSDLLNNPADLSLTPTLKQEAPVLEPTRSLLVPEQPADALFDDSGSIGSSREGSFTEIAPLISSVELFPGILLACPQVSQESSCGIRIRGDVKARTVQEWSSELISDGKRLLFVETGSDDTNFTLETFALDALRSQVISMVSPNVYCVASLCELLSIWSLWVSMDKEMNVFVFDSLCFNPLFLGSCALAADGSLPDAVCTRMLEKVDGVQCSPSDRRYLCYMSRLLHLSGTFRPRPVLIRQILIESCFCGESDLEIKILDLQENSSCNEHVVQFYDDESHSLAIHFPNFRSRLFQGDVCVSISSRRSPSLVLSYRFNTAFVDNLVSSSIHVPLAEWDRSPEVVFPSKFSVQIITSPATNTTSTPIVVAPYQAVGDLEHNKQLLFKKHIVSVNEKVLNHFTSNRSGFDSLDVALALKLGENDVHAATEILHKLFSNTDAQSTTGGIRRLSAPIIRLRGDSPLLSGGSPAEPTGTLESNYDNSLSERSIVDKAKEDSASIRSYLSRYSQRSRTDMVVDRRSSVEEGQERFETPEQSTVGVPTPMFSVITSVHPVIGGMVYSNSPRVALMGEMDNTKRVYQRVSRVGKSNPLTGQSSPSIVYTNPQASTIDDREDTPKMRTPNNESEKESPVTDSGDQSGAVYDKPMHVDKTNDDVNGYVKAVGNETAKFTGKTSPPSPPPKTSGPNAFPTIAGKTNPPSPPPPIGGKTSGRKHEHVEGVISKSTMDGIKSNPDQVLGMAGMPSVGLTMLPNPPVVGKAVSFMGKSMAPQLPKAGMSGIAPAVPQSMVLGGPISFKKAAPPVPTVSASSPGADDSSPERRITIASGQDNNGPLPLGRKLHWKTIRNVESTIWATFESDGVNSSITKLTDFSGIKSVFNEENGGIEQSAGLKRRSGSVSGNSGNPASQQITLFESKRAQNIGVVVARVPIELMTSRLTCLDTLSISVENLERVKMIVPTEEELNMFAQYKGELSVLRDIEQKVMGLFRMARLSQRIRFCLMSLQLPAIVDELYGEIGLLKKCASEVRNSKKLKKVLHVVLLLGNYLNRGDSRGFSIESLSKLSEFKSSSDPGITTMHYLGARLLSTDPGLIELYEDMPTLRALGKVTPESITQGVVMARNEPESIKNEIKIHGAQYTEEALDRMKGFLSTIDLRIKGLVSDWSACEKELVELRKFFGEDPKKISVEDFFSHIRGFIDQLNNTCTDLKKRPKKFEKILSGGSTSPRVITPKATSVTLPGPSESSKLATVGSPRWNITTTEELMASNTTGVPGPALVAKGTDNSGPYKVAERPASPSEIRLRPTGNIHDLDCETNV